MKINKFVAVGFIPSAMLAIALLDCGKSTPQKTPPPSPGLTINSFESRPKYYLEAGPNEIKVAAYNVENLFDTVHNEGIEDYTFLPKGYPGKAEYCQSLTVAAYKRECEDTDWTQAKLNIKLGLLAKAVSKQGPLPDLLAVEEIENENVARQLAGALGYTNFKISRGSDVRGINNALFYKTDKLRPLSDIDDIELGGPEFESHKTRNILRVKFLVVDGPKDAVIEVFVNHWPSQGSRTPKRLAAANALRDAVEAEAEKLGANYYPIALGDFNTLENERPNPFDDVIENTAAWSHAMWDLEKASYAAGNPLAADMPKHSYYYDRDHDWSKLDRVLLGRTWRRTTSGDTQSVGLAAVIDTFRYIADPSILERRRDGTMGPKGFDPTFLKYRDARSQGPSDHLQVAMKFRVR